MKKQLQEIFIKNMVCPRCVMAVETLAQKLEISYDKVELGKIRISKPLRPHDKEEFAAQLKSLGFELINGENQIVISTIKKLLLSLLAGERLSDLNHNLSDYLSEHLHKDYGYLSHLFSEVEGMTIEQYFIRLKIEKVKEWLVYGEKNLSQIAFDLGYSSVAHLSAQFKKITGLTPSFFKKNGAAQRIGLDLSAEQ